MIQSNFKSSKSSFKISLKVSSKLLQSSLKDYELGRNGKESSLNAAIHTSNLNSKTIKGIYAYLKDLNNPSKK